MFMSRFSTQRRFVASVVLVCLLAVSAVGCGKGKSVDGPSTNPDEQPASPLPSTVDLLRKEMGLKDGEGEFAVVGGRVVMADLKNTSVKSLKPLANHPIRELRLNFTKTEDFASLSSLTDVQLLSLEGTSVTDIAFVKSLNLNTLWLNDTKVTDLSPLKGRSLESLDLTGTQITNLTPIAGMPSLRRLNLTKSAVTDLTPLQDILLERIVFDPKKITKGLDGVRNMLSLRKMHVEFQINEENWLQPDEFWKRYDSGTLAVKPAGKK